MIVFAVLNYRYFQRHKMAAAGLSSRLFAVALFPPALPVTTSRRIFYK
jgi:hypothetical protein